MSSGPKWERALVLVDAISADHAAWLNAQPEELALEELSPYPLDERFGAEREAVGITTYLAAVFARSVFSYAARDQQWLAGQWWQALSLCDWLEVVRLLEDVPYSQYRFAWFAFRYLAISVKEWAQHPEMPPVAKRELETFQGTVIRFTDEDLQSAELAAVGVDLPAVRRRLVAELQARSSLLQAKT